ncbi:MAG TPA: sporulation protein YqfC [Clostridia bacterium]|nr:sporulation protein YqfC [Clostridia bacterium]
MAEKTRRRKSKVKNEEIKPKLKEKVTEVLELPKEVVLNLPKLTMVGNRNLIIDNYKGIVEYESIRIRVNTSQGMIRICGEGLTIKEITSEDIMVEGEIASLEFIK